MLVTLKSRILIVDDFELMRRMLKNALSDLGMKSVDECCDGEEAVTVLKKSVVEKRPFHLIFCDWNMPKMNGLELLKFVRAEPGLHVLPFIMVTAESDRKQVIQALQNGATDYIIKPLGADAVKRKINLLNQKPLAKA